ncbi:pentapeptide repeat-containing protein [Streptomyces sp. B22F1]|uniref:pentapeptide repeat-containing protein n=1 Tax=Streptomyces sp. B22F1 TaxID=3153566 RepID=UPI00325D64F9
MLAVVAGLTLLAGLPWLVVDGPYHLDDNVNKLMGGKDTEAAGAALATGLRTALVACAAAVGAGIALIYTVRNYRLTRRGQVTDRFTKALERVGSDEIYVRIGGVLALEQIVQDAPEQATHAAQVLGHFVRERAPDAVPAAYRREVLRPSRPASDVQDALTALTRPESRTHVDARYTLDLSDLHLIGADLRGGDLTGANLRGADLTGADLYRADLTRANLYEADFTGANLYGADLTGADLREADFIDADLYGADLTGADLYDADFTRANLYEADLTGADLREADFTRANLDGADLTGADLYEADFTGANLYEADFTRANLDGADFTGADLGEANLTRAKGLTAEQLRVAHLNWLTQLPAGLAAELGRASG